MSEITCLRCKNPISSETEQCPHCGERITQFQRTYSARLLDGKYQIIDRLGVGGMGEIFKVRHIHLNELRVIKIMRPNVAADDQGLQRFLQEARTSTMIKHKNLAMLYDFAQLEDGSYYMVWEFIDGTNIQKWISSNGPMPPRLTVEIAIQALNGLDHLHSMGLIHRDISPENIMLSQDHHAKLLVKVIDFGIAKQLAEGEGSSGQGLTQTGMFLGKLKYASPEQAGFLKDGEHLDARSDLYSFGIVMYEMLAGKAPFLATNPHSYILKHVTEVPPPIQTSNPDVSVPAELEAMIMKSLEKSRDVRQPSAGEFAAELEDVRNRISPDAKYGLGERIVTLSGAQTLAELSKITSSFTGNLTQQRTSSDGATVIERGIQPGTLSENTPTVIERKVGTSAPTLIERLGSESAPTAVEAKWSGGSEAAPTVLERQIALPKKTNVPLIASIAAAVVIAIVAGVLVMIKQQPQPAAASAASPAVTQVTATAKSAVPMAAGHGVLLLSASPWGDIETIVGSDKKPISLKEVDTSTPARIDLAPGNYAVTVAGPSGGTKTINVAIEAGKPNIQHVDLGSVDVDALVKEMHPEDAHQ